MTRQKRLLIAGGGYADIPMIEAAQKLGFHVISSGNRSEDLGHRISDEYCPADFSDPEAILAVAQRKKIDAICPCANDFSAISSAYVAEKLVLPGHDSFETCRLIHHKDAYREFARSNAIPTPKAKGYSDMESALRAINEFTLPVIVKPVDLTGGKGISKVTNLSDAKNALLKAFSISKAQRVIIEEFITGSHHGFSALIRDGKVVFHFADNEHYYLNPYLVAGASTPARIPDSAVADLITQIETISALLSLKPGIFHVQYILHDQKPVIIEICRRPPGDLYVKLVQYSTQLDYPAWIVKSFAGYDCSEINQVDVKGFFLRHCVMADKAGVLTDIEFSPEIRRNVFDKYMWWKPGDIVGDYLVEKFGIVFMRFHSEDEMHDKTKRMQELIKARIAAG